MPVYPAPLIAVAELADFSVNFIVRPWVNASDYWTVKFAVTEKIKLAFDDAGISIPYLQMDVHIDKSEQMEEVYEKKCIFIFDDLIGAGSLSK